MTTPDSGKGDGVGKSVALWAALTALFTNLAAINVIGLLGGDHPAEWAGALAAAITSVFVAASVYTKIRWDAVKKAAESGGGTAPPTQRKVTR